MLMSQSILTKKHLPGRHDQNRHAGERRVNAKVADITPIVSSTPQTVLADPIIKENGDYTDGVVDPRLSLSYLLVKYGGRKANGPIVEAILEDQSNSSTDQKKKMTQAIMVGASFANSMLAKYPEIFNGMKSLDKEKALAGFLHSVKETAGITVQKNGSASDFVTVADRQQELARLFLRSFGILPEDEDADAAEGALMSVSRAEEVKLKRIEGKIQEVKLQLTQAHRDWEYAKDWNNWSDDTTIPPEPPTEPDQATIQSIIDAESSVSANFVDKLFEGLGDE